MAKKTKMRDGIKQRYKDSWSVVIELGTSVDPVTGKAKRNQRWVTVRGSYDDAVKKRNELRSALDNNSYVDASKLTLGAWLERWFVVEQNRKVRPLRASTISRYRNVLDLRLLKSEMASTFLQKVSALHIEEYYSAQTVSGSTLTLDHAILHNALRKAKKQKLIATNPTEDIDHRPSASRENKSEEVEKHAWSVSEATAFLAEAKKAGTQPAAFYALALHTGMRKSELGGLRWANVDLDSAKVYVRDQLTKTGKEPAWGPTKTGRVRAISIAPEIVTLLRDHRRAQAELKMRNRTSYQDFDLVFAKQWTDVQRRGEMLGHPLQLNNLGQREYDQLIRRAGIRRIKFHGLRHTCATLLLQEGEPVHVVSERLGHASVTMTLEIYAHALPDAQTKAATTIGTLLHGRQLTGS